MSVCMCMCVTRLFTLKRKSQTERHAGIKSMRGGYLLLVVLQKECIYFIVFGQHCPLLRLSVWLLPEFDASLFSVWPGEMSK